MIWKSLKVWYLFILLVLYDVKMVRAGKDDSSKRSTKDLEHLEEDLATLNQVSELVSSLHVSHSVIDEALKEVHNGIQRQLSEKQLATEPHLATIDLAISTQYVYSITFERFLTFTSQCTNHYFPHSYFHKHE